MLRKPTHYESWFMKLYKTHERTKEDRFINTTGDTLIWSLVNNTYKFVVEVFDDKVLSKLTSDIYKDYKKRGYTIIRIQGGDVDSYLRGLLQILDLKGRTATFGLVRYFKKSKTTDKDILKQFEIHQFRRLQNEL